MVWLVFVCASLISFLKAWFGNVCFQFVFARLVFADLIRKAIFGLANFTLVLLVMYGFGVIDFIDFFPTDWYLKI